MFGKNMTGVVYALGIAVLGASINNITKISKDFKTNMILEFRDNTYNLNNTYYENYKEYSNASLIAHSDNYYYLDYYHSGFNSIEKEAYDLFGAMRDATNEEKASVRRYIQGISINTGINFFDLC